MTDKYKMTIVTILKVNSNNHSRKLFKPNSKTLFKYINRFLKFADYIPLEQHALKVAPYTPPYIDHHIRRHFLTAN